MKSRIIGELHALSKGKPTAYMAVLCSELDWKPLQVERQAQIVLKRILHDYSRFSISTIDSFFQRVLKAFNRELGINAAYNVELDEKSILEEAAERLIQSVEEDQKLFDWLNAFASDKIRDGKGWNLKKDIIRLGDEIFDETFKSLGDAVFDKLNDRVFLRQYLEKLSKLIKGFDAKLLLIGKQGISILESESLSSSDFKGKSSSLATAFLKMQTPNYQPSEAVVRNASLITAWVAASEKEPMKSRLTAVAEQKLMPKLEEAMVFIDAERRNYITAKLIQNQLYTLGILVDLRKIVKDLCREKGIILISDSGHLLKKVIGSSDSPFIYEKMGTIYTHFMIDEFQDTSGLQWNNFKPLMANSLAENNLAMVVGDVKQAIYRWRSGDWRLLAGKLPESFPAYGIRNEILNSNWRSHGRIIRFNNTIFSNVAELLQTGYEAELAGSKILQNPVEISIPQIYSDCIQEISKKLTNNSGYVRVRFTEAGNDQKKNGDEFILNELVNSVKMLQDKGVKSHEMAILVRDKKQAKLISDLFLKQKSLPENSIYNMDVLSGESLFIVSSDLIGFIISLLKGFLNPDDQIVRTELIFLYESKICRRLKQAGIQPVFQDIESADNMLSSDQNKKETMPGLSVENDYIFEPTNHTEHHLIGFLSSKELEGLVLGKPVLELDYSLCNKFGLFKLTDEFAYLQAFVDQISGYERNHSADLTTFLNWWDENGERFTIPVSDNIQAIRVMTIHKSKGLEFDHVLIPFFNWSVQPHASPDMAPLLWCRPESAPFNDMEIVPVRYKKDLADSGFFREYFTEKFNTLVDNLNLMYVAFTRAKSGLWIWAPHDEKSATVGNLLYQAVALKFNKTESNQADENSEELADGFNKEEQLFEIGEIPVPDTAAKMNDAQSYDIRMDSFEFSDFRKFLKIKRRGENFFTSDDKRQSGINKGKLIHEILSMVETANDLRKVIQLLDNEGKFGKDNSSQLLNEVSELINDSEVISWFDGTYRVVNERNILTGINGIKRPDRIMIGQDHVVVLDYKSGEFQTDQHKNQLRLYISELTNCGFQNVSGYLWYTKTNTRVRV
jgi:ATP-dependent exoDNAse (exonuclease V) beta subunit